MADYDERLRHRLELQAMQIEHLMSRHGVPVEVQGGTVGNGGVSIDAQAIVASGRDRLRAAARELTRVFGVDKVDLERRDGRLRFRYRRRPRKAVDLLALMDLVPDDVAMSVPLGIDQEARPILLRLDDPEGGNVLIAGAKDAGKSSLLRAVVTGTALKMKQSDVQFVVISGYGGRAVQSRYSLAPLEHFPHFAAPVLESYDDAIEALEWLVREAEFREESGVERPLLVLVIDDLDALMLVHDEAPLNLLGQLLNARAEAGIRVLMGVQDVLSPELRRVLRHNVGLRLVGQMPGERESRAATGMSHAGTDRLPGKGAFLAVSGGEAIRFQAAFIDDYDLHLAIDKSYRRSRGALLAQPVREAVPELPEEQDGREEVSFRIRNGSGRVVLDGLDEDSELPAAGNAAGVDEEAAAGAADAAGAAGAADVVDGSAGEDAVNRADEVISGDEAAANGGEVWLIGGERVWVRADDAEADEYVDDWDEEAGGDWDDAWDLG